MRLFDPACRQAGSLAHFGPYFGPVNADLGSADTT